jgi:diadenosine tetraphosphate (Ap4A) HIT family hydrolase
MHDKNCDLCTTDGGEILFAHDKFRVVAVLGEEGEIYTGFCRVIWNNHVREMTDLAHEDRDLIMRAVYCVEAALRLSLNPDKINLASLGNMTPHVHWHVIPRYHDDATYPKPIWGSLNSHNLTTKPASIATLAQNSDENDWKRAVKAALQATFQALPS